MDSFMRPTVTREVAETMARVISADADYNC